MAEQEITASTSELNSIELATELTIAWLNNPNNRVAAEDVPAFLMTMHNTLNELSSGEGSAATTAEHQYTPAVSPRTSVKKDRLISLIDGKPYKTLKRHLANHGLTPAEYRERYGLKADYPMVAPDYSAARSEMARKIGLGSKGRDARQSSAAAAAPQNGGAKNGRAAAPKAKGGARRGRKPAAASTIEG